MSKRITSSRFWACLGRYIISLELYLTWTTRQSQNKYGDYNGTVAIETNWVNLRRPGYKVIEQNGGKGLHSLALLSVWFNLLYALLLWNFWMEESTTKAEEALYLIVEGVSYKGLYVLGCSISKFREHWMFTPRGRSVVECNLTAYSTLLFSDVDWSTLKLHRHSLQKELTLSFFTLPEIKIIREIFMFSPACLVH